MLIKLLSSSALLLLGVTLPMYAQAVPGNPREIIRELYTYNGHLRPDREEYDAARRAVIARNPERFVPIIREYLAVPDRLEDIDLNDPATRERYFHGGGLFLPARAVQALGREHADPILVELFVRSRPLFEEADAEHIAAWREHREAGWSPGEPILPEFEARLHRVGQLRSLFNVRMNLAVIAAGEIRSPVLIDPVLEFFEDGLIDRQGEWPRYLLMFAGERPDVIPRMRAIMDNPETDRSVRVRIRRAFEWYATTLAEAEGDDAAVAQRAPQPSARPEAEEPEPPKR